MIDFTAGTTELLLNPRLPAADRRRCETWLSDTSHPAGLVWLMTSGSSGAPKLVGLAREAILASARAVNQHLEAGPADTWLLALPSFHVGGLGVWARAHVSGARVVDLTASGRWDPRRFVAEVEQRGVTLTALVPAQLFDLARERLRCPARLRAIVIGGGALSPELYRRARRLGYPVLPSYGLTECASQVATAPLASLLPTGSPSRAAPRDPGELPPLALLPHVEARIDGDGRLRIRSASLLAGYLAAENGEARFVDPRREGWLVTEDRAEVRDGVLRVAGRDASFVKVGGESTDLGRLAALLDDLRLELLPDGDAVVVAEPDERLGARVVLAVARGTDERAVAALREAFDAAVLPFERIRAVYTLESLPRSPLGKLELRKLLALLGRDDPRP